jgi:phosphatidylserine decarboxylase
LASGAHHPTASARTTEQAGYPFQQRAEHKHSGTHHFGRLGFEEIGALSVGRIVQTHPLDKSFDRGQEKSVFRFGGSAIAVFASKEMAECDRLDKRSEP